MHADSGLMLKHIWHSIHFQAVVGSFRQQSVRYVDGVLRKLVLTESRCRFPSPSPAFMPRSTSFLHTALSPQTGHGLAASPQKDTEVEAVKCQEEPACTNNCLNRFGNWWFFFLLLSICTLIIVLYMLRLWFLLLLLLIIIIISVILIIISVLLERTTAFLSCKFSLSFLTLFIHFENFFLIDPHITFQ